MSTSEDLDTTSWWRRRSIWMSVYGVALVAYIVTYGMMADFFLLFAWLWAATVCWRIAEPLRIHLLWLRDWGPLLLLLFGYTLSRGLANGFLTPHVTEMITFDKAIFGGQIPTVWLQEKLYDPGVVHWWDVYFSFVYMSHFIVSLAIGVALYLFSRRVWRQFMHRWLLLTAAGLATYFLYPAAPPWWASEHGYIAENVARLSSYGWRGIGLDTVGTVFDAGVKLSNPTAAMPSLHAGWSMMAIAFFLPRVRKRWWPLLFAYPLSMMVTLVYTGDHYLADIFAGWVYVAAACFAVSYAEKVWKRRRSAQRVREAPPTAVVEEDTGSRESTKERVSVTVADR